MQKYVYIKDSNNRTNLWEIISSNCDQYIVKSRNSKGVILKDSCYSSDTSSLLYCDEILDIEKSDIEIENKLKNSHCLTCGYCNRNGFCSQQRDYINNITHLTKYCFSYFNSLTMRKQEQYQDEDIFDNSNNGEIDLFEGTHQINIT